MIYDKYMNDKLKEIIIKDIKRIVDVEYEGYYIPYMSEINAKLFKFFGKKGNELVSAILEFFTKNEDFKSGSNELLTELLLYYVQYPNFYDPNIIVDYILEDKLEMKELTLVKIFNLISFSNNINLLSKVTKNITRLFTMSDVFKQTIKLLSSNKKMASNPDAIELCIKLFVNITNKNHRDINYIVDMIYYIGKFYLKLPVPIQDKVIQYIDSLSFADQSKISFEVNNIPKELFTKLNKTDGYTIIGRPDIRTGLVLIKSENELYGYIDFNSHKIIISPMFDEISSVNKKHQIIGKVLKKRSEMDPGYYKMDSEGRIIEFNPFTS